MNGKNIFFFIAIFVLMLIGCTKKKTAYEIQQDSLKKELANIPLGEDGRIAKIRPYPDPLPDSISQRKLSNSFQSIDEVCKNILLAVEKKNVEALRSYTITHDEFSKWMWYELRESRPIMNSKIWILWEQIERKNEQGLVSISDKYFGQKLTFVSYELIDKDDVYQTYILHQGLKIKTKDTKGNIIYIKEIGSVVEMNKIFKILSYGKN